MSDLTLPGDIPGLLRDCSPAWVVEYGMRTACVVLRVESGQAFVARKNGAVGWAGLGDLEFRLDVATGRAHAVWWLVSRDRPADVIESGVSWWVCVDYWPARIEGVCADRHFGFNVPRADNDDEGLDPDDPRTLPDGSRWVYAEALRRVVLHVAGRADG